MWEKPVYAAEPKVIRHATSAVRDIHNAGPYDVLRLSYGGWTKSLLRLEKRMASTINATIMTIANRPEEREAKTAPALEQRPIILNPKVTTERKAAGKTVRIARKSGISLTDWV